MSDSVPKRMPFIAKIAAIVIPVAALVSCTSRGAQIATVAADPPTVAVVKAARADLSTDVVLTAEFEPFQEIDVLAKVSGYLRDIKVDIGDRVREGQLLATLEIPEMQDDLTKAAAAVDQADAEVATAGDELRRAEAAHELAHLSYTRIADVVKREPGLVPQQDVDEARSRDLVAEAQVSAAKSSRQTAQERARVARAEQTRLTTLYQYRTIAAPFSGVITRRYANTGALIQAGTASQSQAMPVVRLSENSLLRLALPAPESVVPLIRLGEPVAVKVSALNRTFPGRVARFADTVDPSTRTMKTEVDVPNPDLTLVPGMYAEVDLVTEQRRRVLAVPVEAIDGSGQSVRVFRVQASGAIEIIPIRVGIETARMVEVRQGDLSEGDAVVVGSHSGLKAGDIVRPKAIELAGDSVPAS
ncbi:MAG TPA: efflux RND transporter periplasmic adaptor subunit [Bryobacteraceae bacterium]